MQMLSAACVCCLWDVRELGYEAEHKDIDKKWTKDTSLWSPKNKALRCATGNFKEDIA